MTLLDRTNMTGLAVSTAEMSNLRRQWPQSPDDTGADQPGVDAAGMQAPVSQPAGRHMLVLWATHCT